MVRAQPVMDHPGGRYGERKALREQQQAAPLPAVAPPGGMTTRRGAPASGGVFGPTERPDESMTAGIPWGDGTNGHPDYLGDDPDLVLRAVYSVEPNPALGRLLARITRG